jgi:hypothetical protein
MKRWALAAIALASAWPTASRAADAQTPVALFDQGTDLFRHGDYEGARAAFARAYELDPKPRTLFNLGLSELNSNHPVEAATHLRSYLTHNEEPAAKRESVRTKWLPRAEAHTARLTVFAPAGAQLSVDGVAQQAAAATDAPPGGPTATVTVSAGEHDVTSRLGTAAETQHVAPKSGEAIEVHFQRVPDAPTTSTAAWVPAREAGDRAEATPSRAKWITVIALGSGALVAAGLGVGFEVASGNNAADAQKVQNQVASGSAWNGEQCAGSSSSSALCSRLRTDVDSNRLNWTIATASYVAAGVLGAAAAATWVLWRPRAAVVTARPAVGRQTAGVVLSGQW